MSRTTPAWHLRSRPPTAPRQRAVITPRRRRHPFCLRCCQTALRRGLFCHFPLDLCSALSSVASRAASSSRRPTIRALRRVACSEPSREPRAGSPGRLAWQAPLGHRAPSPVDSCLADQRSPCEVLGGRLLPTVRPSLLQKVLECNTHSLYVNACWGEFTLRATSVLIINHFLRIF